MKTFRFFLILFISCLWVIGASMVDAKTVPAVDSPAASTKIAAFPHLFKPDMMEITDKYIYIVEKTTVFIHDGATYKEISKFGREGEGPQEFKISPFGPPMMVTAAGDRLVINSLAKVSIYSAQGTYISEFKTPPNQVYLPFGDGYVYTGISKTEENKKVMAINLADASFVKTAQLYLSDWEVGAAMSFSFPISSFAFAATAESLFVVAGKEGFVIDRFDTTGKRLIRIKKEFTPLSIPADYAKNTLNWFKTHPNWKNLYDLFKDRISFKTQYPPIYSMNYSGDRLYVLTYKTKGEERECIVLDLDGKEIKRLFLPVLQTYGLGELPKYKFFKNAFYILVEDDDEVIRLHRRKI